nr:hypothetical protein [Salinibacterium sp. PAMC 21357]
MSRGTSIHFEMFNPRVGLLTEATGGHPIAGGKLSYLLEYTSVICDI